MVVDRYLQTRSQKSRHNALALISILFMLPLSAMCLPAETAPGGAAQCSADLKFTVERTGLGAVEGEAVQDCIEKMRAGCGDYTLGNNPLIGQPTLIGRFYQVDCSAYCYVSLSVPCDEIRAIISDE